MTRTSLLLGAATMLALLSPGDAGAQKRTSDIVREAKREASREIQRELDRELRSARREGRGTVDTTVAFDRRGTVSVSIPDGEIVVTGWDRDAVRVHATSEDGAIRFSASSGRVTVEPDGFRRSSDYHIEITVPLGTRVSARALSGDVAVRGTRGEVEVSAQNGDVRLEEVGGRVEVSTLSGDVDLARVVGDVELKSVSGDVTVATVKGDIQIETVSGEIDIDEATARFVRAHTTSGDVRYVGTIDPQGRYELSTHSGDVRLTVPPDVGAQISISTWSGTVESEFPLTLRPGEHGIGSSSAKRFTFEVGNGSSRVTLASFSGDITINSASGRGRP
jgi:DUF4097 and DUF4098 domain-containing protein YvlB